MVAAMLEKNIPADVIVLAVRTAEQAVTLVTALPAALPQTRSRKALNQSAYRERNKQKQTVGVAMAANPKPVTQPVTNGNAVTSAPLSLSSSLTFFGSPLTEENKKEEKKEVDRKVVVEGRKRGARLPDDWQPSEVDIQFARGEGLTARQTKTETTKFRNYWTNRTDKLAAKPRWDLAWQNWILNIRKETNGNGQSVIAAADRLNEKLAAFQRDDLLTDLRGGAGAVDVRMLPPRSSR
jgi:hypothetical protein